eukprot:Gregarina_sp_Poly_1__5470@NODE_2890_length_1582_cov_11_184818_g1826_i0_p1_GENE_NODE_2890_length_1582_cov_11_184818_g1826_i0NODE_2890_length_1582_cov_11_184818_g1826_i0_p1_ORF_typecomplete_len420_score33_72_NODE_2890_length_1582_cov_11_184818_g1826_i02171476
MLFKYLLSLGFDFGRGQFWYDNFHRVGNFIDGCDRCPDTAANITQISEVMTCLDLVSRNCHYEISYHINGMTTGPSCDYGLLGYNFTGFFPSFSGKAISASGMIVFYLEDTNVDPSCAWRLYASAIEFCPINPTQGLVPNFEASHFESQIMVPAERYMLHNPFVSLVPVNSSLGCGTAIAKVGFQPFSATFAIQGTQLVGWEMTDLVAVTENQACAVPACRSTHSIVTQQAAIACCEQAPEGCKYQLTARLEGVESNSICLDSRVSLATFTPPVGIFEGTHIGYTKITFTVPISAQCVFTVYVGPMDCVSAPPVSSIVAIIEVEPGERTLLLSTDIIKLFNNRAYLALTSEDRRGFSKSFTEPRCGGAITKIEYSIASTIALYGSTSSKTFASLDHSKPLLPSPAIILICSNILFCVNS